jgi:hypothetical protein
MTDNERDNRIARLMKDARCRLLSLLDPEEGLSESEQGTITASTARFLGFLLGRRLGRDKVHVTQESIDDLIRTIIEDAIIDGLPPEEVADYLRRSVIGLVGGFYVWDGKSKPRYEVLAAGPAFAGELTRPYRRVVLKWDGGEYSVHTEYLDETGGVGDGHYFGGTPQGLVAAVSRWSVKVEQELQLRPNCLVGATS